MIEAYHDREKREYDWFTIMEHQWEDGFGNKHLVKDLYEQNLELIDLTRVPDWVKNGIRIDMLSQLEKKDSMQASQIGFDFMILF